MENVLYSMTTVNFKILHRNKLKHGILAKWLFHCLGDRKGTHVVISDKDVVYFIGSLADCKNYVRDDEAFFRELEYE